MVAVIFEVCPAPDREADYLELAAALRPLLEHVDGFLSIERYRSLTDPGKILSLSFFRDEESVARWRQVQEHRRAQSAGRGGIFAGYRLRIADVTRDYGLHERREQAPADSESFHGADV